jgi:hypothetical protein
MRDHLPIVIELVFVFGGVLLFAWWQLHEIKVDQRQAAAKRAADKQTRAAAVPADPAPAPPAAHVNAADTADRGTKAPRTGA